METLVIAIVAIVAFTAVLWPLLRGRGSVADSREFYTDAPVDETFTRAAHAGNAAPPIEGLGHAAHDRIEREVLRYRAALRAGTLCPRCGQANPPGSVYCADCGKPLPLADAKEFA